MRFLQYVFEFKLEGVLFVKRKLTSCSTFLQSKHRCINLPNGNVENREVNLDIADADTYIFNFRIWKGN